MVGDLWGSFQVMPLSGQRCIVTLGVLDPDGLTHSRRFLFSKPASCPPSTERRAASDGFWVNDQPIGAIRCCEPMEGVNDKRAGPMFSKPSSGCDEAHVGGVVGS